MSFEFYEDDEKLARLLQRQFDLQDGSVKIDDVQNLPRDHTCDVCKVGVLATDATSSTIRPLMNCRHNLCHKCALREIVQLRRPSMQSEYLCPIQNCFAKISEADIRALLPPSEVDRFVNSGLNETSLLSQFSRL